MKPSVKNTQKQQLRINDVLSMIVDYNEGYEYRSFEVVIEDGDHAAYVENYERNETLLAP